MKEKENEHADRSQGSAAPEVGRRRDAVAWHKQAGERSSATRTSIDLETDKVVLEVPAPAAGVIKDHQGRDGATVTSGQVIAQIEPRRRRRRAAAPAKRSRRGGGAEAGRSGARPRRAATGGGGSRSAARKGRRAEARCGGRSPAPDAAGASPRATCTCASEGAPGSRRCRRRAAGAAPAARGATADTRGRADRAARADDAAARAHRRAPRAGAVDRGDAHHLQRSRTCSRSSTCATRYKDRFEKEHGVKLGFMSFFVKAAVER